MIVNPPSIFNRDLPAFLSQKYTGHNIDLYHNISFEETSCKIDLSSAGIRTFIIRTRLYAGIECTLMFDFVNGVISKEVQEVGYIDIVKFSMQKLQILSTPIFQGVGYKRGTKGGKKFQVI